MHQEMNEYARNCIYHTHKMKKRIIKKTYTSSIICNNDKICQSNLESTYHIEKRDSDIERIQQLQ